MTAVASNPSKEEETEQSLVEKYTPQAPLTISDIVFGWKSLILIEFWYSCLWCLVCRICLPRLELPTLVLMSSFQVNRYCNGILRRISNQSKQQWRSYRIRKQSQYFWNYGMGDFSRFSERGKFFSVLVCLIVFVFLSISTILRHSCFMPDERNMLETYSRHKQVSKSFQLLFKYLYFFLLCCIFVLWASLEEEWCEIVSLAQINRILHNHSYDSYWLE